VTIEKIFDEETKELQRIIDLENESYGKLAVTNMNVEMEAFDM
jgi:hypothetical protein